MKNDKNLYMYRAFGLTIGSTVEIPELLPAVEAVREPDVVIRRGPVPETLQSPKFSGVRFQASPGHFLLKVDNIARYEVSGGSRVTVEALPEAEERDLRLFLLSSVFGALIHQRGLLPLHASAIKVENQCVVFCGASGSGKSTIAKAFIKRGYPLHTDDISVVSAGEDGMPVAYPGYPQLKLWEDALKKTGMAIASYTRVRRVLDKFAVPVPDRFHQEPLSIRKIYSLAPWMKGEIELSEITGMKKFNVLKRHTYRFRFVEGLEQEVSHFKAAGILGRIVPICGVRRPQNLFLLDQLADLLENDFIK